MQRARGLRYLELATALLRCVREEDPTAGVLESADLHWWWRKPRRSDEIDQLFWVDGMGRPEAGLIAIDWDGAWGLEPVVLPSRALALVPEIWNTLLHQVRRLPGQRFDVQIRDDDVRQRDLAAERGFVATGDRGVSTMMRVTDRPTVSKPPTGYALADRRSAPSTPHHMIGRNGPEVAERLAATSLYRADLDLFVTAPSGEVAAYGLFWFDPVTRVGFVEPMRTEEEHQRRGLGRHVLTAGLDRLARLGAEILKINYVEGHLPSEALYLGAGFREVHRSGVYGRRSDAGE